MRRLFSSVPLAMLLILLLASTAMAAESTAQVDNPNPEDRLNLRTEPNFNAPTLGKYYNGVHVELLGDEKDGWIEVRFGNLAGYMRAEFLEPDGKGFVNSVLPSYTIHNTEGDGLHLRESQSLHSKSLGFYANGETGWVYGVSEAWCHVQAPDGKVGFMLREKLSPVLEFDKSAGGSGGATPPAAPAKEGSAYGRPGDPITDDFMPGGNG